MKIYGTGYKRNEVRRASISFEGSDMEFVHLVDELDRAARESNSTLLMDIVHQLNWRTGNQIDYPEPVREITPSSSCHTAMVY